MAKRNIPTRRTGGKSRAAGDRKVTRAEQRRAQDRVIRAGAHQAPINGLVDRNNPGQTVASCRGIIDWLAHIGEPFNSQDLDAAKADVLHLVVDALEHVERQIRDYWKAEQVAS